ncbi:hypothetical protein F511_28674 [Dorcoceras hygrometricum]|uniref:Uncharacterized protein n=1 Tax=Dorcoceras hygrometricum TaxID=472368 RepID=A0A2Z7A9T8_9LAMI|nr:hypothetical protein F511_28674 [Dorcoceras hygrometricum]
MAGDRRSDRNNEGEGPSNPNSGGGLSREYLMTIATIVATTLQGLVNPNNNNQDPPPPPRGTKFYYESLRKNKAPTFDGSHDPEVAQTWMKNIETQLRLLEITSRPSLPLSHAAAAAVFVGKLVSGQLDVENPFVLISSGLLVQPDEGVSDLVVDRIGVSTAIYREEPGS